MEVVCQHVTVVTPSPPTSRSSSILPLSPPPIQSIALVIRITHGVVCVRGENSRSDRPERKLTSGVRIAALRLPHSSLLPTPLPPSPPPKSFQISERDSGFRRRRPSRFHLVFAARRRRTGSTCTSVVVVIIIISVVVGVVRHRHRNRVIVVDEVLKSGFGVVDFLSSFRSPSIYRSRSSSLSLGSSGR